MMIEAAGKNAESGGDAAEIAGVVTRVVYRSDETGYSVLAVALERGGGKQRVGGGKDGAAGGEEATVVGNCAAVWVGETLKATGCWTRHHRHGRQFQAEQITCIAPVSVEGIRMFLASGLIKGVGEVMADRLMQAFGEDTLRIIDRESARLMEVPGIGAKKRDTIKQSWNAQKAVREIMVFLRGHGVGAAQAMRIYRQYGDESVAVVMKNPYRLCRDVWGIGFKSADKIAISLGVPPESDIRARAGILHVLQTMAEDGHCFCPWDALLEEGQALLGISSDILHRAIQAEVADRSLMEEDGNVYPAPLFHAEKGVAEKLRELVRTPADFKPIDVSRAIPWAEDRMTIRFAPAQAEALMTALSEKVSIITGGPGVGKTTIVRALVDVFQARKLKVMLAAPTGRAAKRLSEATRCEAMTIHRLLKYQPRTGRFEHDSETPLEGDVLVLDEVSMVDIALMNHVMKALPGRCVLTLVGDSDQLPSVGPGNVLRDMMSSCSVPCIRLDVIFRQTARSSIVTNAHRVNRGEPMEFSGEDADSDFFFIRSDSPDDMIAKTLDLVVERIPRRFGFDARTDIQVLTPMRRNQLGAENLNVLLQEKLNPRGPSVSRYGYVFRIGDRVMQIRNNYDKGVFNGDIGIVAGLDAESQVVSVDFDGNLVAYEHSDMDEIALAYACSIHKSQGSEYPAVVILMATQHFKLLQRNLLYTGITRGKKLVCLVGSHKAVHMAIRNNRTMLRRTSLAKRLAGMGGGRIVTPEPDA